MKKKLYIAICFILLVAAFLFLYNRIYFSTGNADQKQTILIERGDNAVVVGERLQKKGIITNKYYLLIYLWQKKQVHSLVAGVYDFSSGLKIPEVARIITGGEVASTRIPITFPEGWTAKDMAKRLDANGFSGDEFLSIVNNPSDELKEKYSFLKEIPRGKSMEGYLFPDTYYFAKDASADDIVGKMLNNFSGKTEDAQSAATAQKKTFYQIITMASILEGEVKTEEDRKIVAGIFYSRIANNMALGSDATLEYVLGTNKLQHSINETQTDSPYNTYRNKGLPPGPVSNPGIEAINAAINPTKTDYTYFLSDPKTGKTVFSKTFDEHVANKAKYGL